MTRAEVLATQQRVGVVLARSATKQRREIRRVLQPKILGYLRVVGAVATRQNPEVAEQFRMPPSNATQQALLTAGRAILEKATAQKDALVSLGMSVQVLDELAKALGEFEQTLEATRAGRRGHVGASAELEALDREMAEQVKLLDGLVRYRFGDNAELMGAWASARNVLGPFKAKGDQIAPAA